MARVAIVTGGTRGIGEAICLRLQKQGHTVIANFGGNFAMMLTAMAGSDSADPASKDADANKAADYTAGLSTDALKGKKIGIIRGFGGYSEKTQPVFDAAVGGLGGCPYAAGASGNLATEDLVWLLDGLGIATGIDLDALINVAAWISAELGRDPASRVARAVLAKRVQRAATPAQQ